MSNLNITSDLLPTLMKALAPSSDDAANPGEPDTPGYNGQPVDGTTSGGLDIGPLLKKAATQMLGAEPSDPLHQQLIDTFNEVAASTAASKQQLVNYNKDIAGAGNQYQAGADANAVAQEKINLAQQQNTLSQQNYVAQTAAAFGLAEGTGPGSIAETAKTIQAKSMDLDALRNQVEQKMSVSLFDDPVQYIKNRLTLPHDQALLKQKADDFGSTLAGFEAKENAVTSAGKNAALMDSTGSALKLDGLNDQALAKAQMEKGVSALAIAQAGTSNVNMQNADTVEKYHSLVALNDAMAKHVQLGIEQTQTGLLAARTFTQNQEDVIRNGLNSEKLEDQNTANTYMSRANIALGGTPLTTQQLKMMDPKRREELLSAAAHFGDPNNPNYGQDAAGVASDPANSVALLSNVAGPANLGLQQTLKGAQKVLQASLQSEAYLTAQRNHDPAGIHQSQVSALQDTGRAEMNNISPSNNIYIPPSMSSVAKLPLLNGTDLANDASTLVQGKANIPYDPKLLADTAALDVENGKRSVGTVAQQISTASTQALSLMNQAGQYNKIGLLPLHSEETGYKTTVSVGGKALQVDWSNPSSVQNYLVRSRVAKVMEASRLDALSGVNGQ